MADNNALIRRYEAAKAIWDQWTGIWSDAYRYALPGRPNFFTKTEGEKRTQEIYDETAVVALPEFASKIVTIMMPPFMRWTDLKAGSDVPPDVAPDLDAALVAVNQKIFDIINASTFNQAANEAMIDGAIGTGALVIEEDPGEGVIRCTGVPLTDVVIERGAFGGLQGFFRARTIKGRDVAPEYPKASLPEGLANKFKSQPDQPHEFLECTTRDWSRPMEEVWQYTVVMREGMADIYKATFEGIGSCPWIAFRWAAASGETYGRGPLLNVMSAVKTCNLAVELTLANADIAVSGIWQYDHDGVMNPDTVQLVPGTMIPRAPGSRGLEAVQSASNFDIANIILQDQRQNIKRGLYVAEFASLDKTPQSATEVIARQQDLAQRIGASYGRLQVELVNAVVRRVAFLARRRNLIRLPRIDGRLVKIDPLSPLARAQNESDIQAIERFLMTVGQLFGPQMVNLIAKPDEAARVLAKLHRVPPTILRSPQEFQQLQGQLMQAMQQMRDGGEAPDMGALKQAA